MKSDVRTSLGDDIPEKRWWNDVTDGTQGAKREGREKVEWRAFPKRHSLPGTT